MSKPKTLRLSQPIAWDDRTLMEIQVRRPKVKDLTYAGLRDSLRFLVPKAERKFGPPASPVDPPRPEPPAGPEP